MNTMSMSHRPSRRTSLQRRLVLLFLLIGLLPALIISLLSQQQAASALSRRTQSDLANISFSALDKLDRTLFERYGDALLFSTSPRTSLFLKGSVRRFMDDSMASYAPMYRLMILADEHGDVVATNTVGPDGQPINTSGLTGRNVRSLVWFQAWNSEQARTSQKTFVQDMYAEPLLTEIYGDTRYTVAFSYPVFNQDGAWRGVWVNFFNWDVAQLIIEEALEPARRAGQSQIGLLLMDQTGRVIGSSDATWSIGTQIDLIPFQPSISAARGSNGQQQPMVIAAPTLEWQGLLAGTTVSHGYGAYSGVGWIAVATQPPSEALASVRALQLQIALFGGMIALVVILAAASTARSLANPLLAITLASQRAAAGDLNQRVAPQGNDEVSDLATAFNQMTSQLAEARTGLEQKVSSRTEELQQALNELRASGDERARLYDQLRRVSIPMVPLTDQVALVTLVGELSGDRADQLLDVALRGVEVARVRVLLLDITGVPVVDTQVANVLLQMARGVRLLGCELVLVGIAPEVAQTIVQLGIDFDTVTTRGMLQEGLAYALARTRQKG